MASAIGATAISSVTRSCSMRRSTSSRSKRGMQPDRRAGLGRGEQVQQAEDVRRRGGDLEAVVRSEAERHHPVRRAGADRRVGVAYRLGQPGRAGTEDEHGLVAVAHRAGIGRRIGSLESAPEDRRRVEVVRPAPIASFPASSGAVVGVSDRVRRVGDVQRMTHLAGFPRRADEHGGGIELADARRRRRRTRDGWPSSPPPAGRRRRRGLSARRAKALLSRSSSRYVRR